MDEMLRQPLAPRPAARLRAATGEAAASSLVARRTVLAGGVLALAGAAAVHFGALGAGPDEVPPEEIARRAAQLTQLGPLPLHLVTQAEAAAALDGLGLPAPDRAQLAADLEAKRARLTWLTLYDSDVEDGDVVEVRAGGLSQTVRLAKAPVRVAVPVPEGGGISLVGAVDGGGGGVTVGVMLDAEALPLPPLSVGQTLILPVRAGR